MAFPPILNNRFGDFTTSNAETAAQGGRFG
jgi:hypothetical protein